MVCCLRVSLLASLRLHGRVCRAALVCLAVSMAVLLAAPAATAQPSVRTIRTVAGDGNYGMGGDGGPATQAQIVNPMAVARDAAGNLYIADTANNKIRKVDAATGIIGTIAGTGEGGYTGDGGPATQAAISWPMALAVDGSGNVYFNDYSRSVVRRVDAATGIITRFAGTFMVSGDSGDGGAATLAQMMNPYGVAVDAAGAVYIADQGANKVRKVAAGTGIITTVAGRGLTVSDGDGGPATLAGMVYPQVLALDAAGNLYISDYQTSIRKVDAASGIISTIAGTNGTWGYAGDGGPATTAQFSSIGGLAIDAGGNVYVGDNGNYRVRMIDAATGFITTIAGTGTYGFSGDGGPAADAKTSHVTGVAADGAGNVWFADQDNYRIRLITSPLVPVIADSPSDQGVSVGGTLQWSLPVTGDPMPALQWQVSTDGGSHFTDLSDGGVYSGATTGTLAITSATYSLNGNRYRLTATNVWGVAVSSAATLTVQLIQPVITWANPAPITPGTALDATQLNATASVPGTFTYNPPAGTVMSVGSDQVLSAVFVPADPMTYAGWTKAVLIDVVGANGEGARYITSVAGNSVYGFAGDGGPATSAAMTYPQNIYVDQSGNLYIPDSSNHRVRKVTAATGIITTIAGTGTSGFNGDGLPATATQFSLPVAVAADAAGNLYIADLGNGRVRKIDANTGLVSTFAGTGAYASSGDGGPATAAALHSPRALAFDPAGNLYISDSDAGQVRQVAVGTGLISTVISGITVYGLQCDGAGNLYFADYYPGSRVRMRSASTGLLATVAGNGTYGSAGDGGPATAAELNYPAGVALDSEGNVYIAEYWGHRIRRVARATGTISTIAGDGTFAYAGDGGPSTTARFRSPAGLAILGDDVFVSDTGNYRVRKIAEGAAPVVTAEPADKSTEPGGTVAFPAAVSGFPGPTFQWYLSTNGTTWQNLSDTAPYSGSFAPSLTITGATLGMSGYQYHLVATNVIGTATSRAATLTVAAVVKETPVITWPAPVAITYGTLLSSTQLNATANVAGTFAYTPPVGTKLSGGAHTLSVLFTPDDAATYTTATAEVSLSVYPAPSLITWPDPAGVVYGTALGAAQLNATANVPGSFLYSPAAGTVLGAGTHYLSVFFTPTASGDYAPSSASASITVGQATPVITWATPAPIVFGTAIGPAQLNATANVPGMIVYTPTAGSLLSAGSHWLTADFTPADSANYQATTAKVLLSVWQATPIISWPSPAPMLHMTPLGATQFNATASVPGTFTYWPDPGTVLPIGPAQQLHLNFTPTDTYNYLPVSANTTVDVVPFGPVITTIAGNYPDAAGYSGDGGPATAARFHGPRGISTDPAGNIYVVDERNYRIRRIAAGTTTVSTIAGSGDVYPAEGGYAGDGGPATAARFGYMSHVVADGAGNLYIADSQNWRVRKVTAATGVVTTMAGTGVQGYAGDGGLATAARLGWVNSLALDSAGNLYLADTNNSRIRRIAAASGIITTVAGSSTSPGFAGDGGAATAARLYEPNAIALDIAGNLYIADTDNHRVRKVMAATGVISTLAGDGIADYAGDGGPATAARLNYPNGVAVDAAGNVFIADAMNNRIRKIDAATGIISTVAGNGDYHGGIAGDGEEAVLARLGTVMGIGLDPAGNLLIPGWDSNTVRRVSALGAPTYWLTVAPAPVHGVVAGGGINCGTAATACQAGFATATTVTLTATPDTDYVFKAWGGACSGTDASTTVDVGASTACTATFGPVAPPDGPPYTFTVTTPAGGRIQGAGINCGAGGTACSITMPAAMTLGISATASSGYTFTGWTGDCTGSTASIWVALNGPRTCGATFTPVGGGGGLPSGPPYTLTISMPAGGKVSGAGINCGAGGTACSVTMPAAMTLGIGAVASAGYAFAGWTGDCTGTIADLWVALNGPRACGATFTPVGGGGSFALTISPAPTDGTVTGSGLTCGAGGSACSVTLAGGTIASLTAAPSPGYVFSGWSGACSGTTAATTVLVDAARTCSAIFTASGGGPVNGPPYTLTVTSPTGGMIQGAGINCGAGGTACSVTMPAAMTLGISATPSAGYAFTAWTGDCTGTTTSQWVALNGPRTCGATFTATGGGGGGGGGLPSGPPYTLTITMPTGGKVSGAGIDCGAGGTACSVTMPASMTLGVSATPSAGYTFTGWTGDCAGTSPSLWVALGGARTCGATFTPSGGAGH